MSIVNRKAARQDSTVRLEGQFYHNGVLTDPYSLGNVEILDPHGNVVNTLTPVRESTGSYYVDFVAGADIETGWYGDRWNEIVYDAGWDAQQILGAFYIQLYSWGTVTANTCRVYDYIYKSDGTPFANTTGYASITVLPYDYNNAFFTNPSDEGLSATTDVNGYIFWDIIWGATAVFEIEVAGIGKKVIIPEQDTVRLADLVEVLI